MNLTSYQLELIMEALDLSVKRGGLKTAAQLLPIAFEIEKQLTSSKEDVQEN